MFSFRLFGDLSSNRILLLSVFTNRFDKTILRIGCEFDRVQFNLDN